MLARHTIDHVVGEVWHDDRLGLTPPTHPVRPTSGTA
jgi:hypothetical protein